MAKLLTFNIPIQDVLNNRIYEVINIFKEDRISVIYGHLQMFQKISITECNNLEILVRIFLPNPLHGLPEE